MLTRLRSGCNITYAPKTNKEYAHGTQTRYASRYDARHENSTRLPPIRACFACARSALRRLRFES